MAHSSGGFSPWSAGSKAELMGQIIMMEEKYALGGSRRQKKEKKTWDRSHPSPNDHLKPGPQFIKEGIYRGILYSVVQSPSRYKAWLGDSFRSKPQHCLNLGKSLTVPCHSVFP